MRCVVFVAVLLGGCGRIDYDLIDAGRIDDASLDHDARDGGDGDGGLGTHLRFTIAAGMVGADLDSFPLLVIAGPDMLADVGGVTGTAAFVLVEDGSELDYDLRAPGSSGPLIAWVRVPRIHRDAATEIDLLFRAMAPANDPSAVWRDSAGVWHLDDTPSGAIADATEKGGDGVSAGGMDESAQVIGVGHTALEFDGVDDGITIDRGPAVTTVDPLTISFWARNRLFGDNGPPLITRATTFGGRNNDFIVRAWTSCLGGGLYNGADFNLSCVNWDDTDVWHHVALVLGDGNMSFYFDGVLQEQVPYSGGVAAAGHPFRIATFGVADPTRTWNGAVDEVWFASSARSPEWIAALHASQSGDPFYQVTVAADAP